jgi:hypothetical protein
MSRTLIATSLAFFLALATPPVAHADQLHGQSTIASGETTNPFVSEGGAGTGGRWSRNGIIGGDGTTGPTFPIRSLPQS